MKSEPFDQLHEEQSPRAAELASDIKLEVVTLFGKLSSDNQRRMLRTLKVLVQASKFQRPE